MTYTLDNAIRDLTKSATWNSKARVREILERLEEAIRGEQKEEYICRLAMKASNYDQQIVMLKAEFKENEKMAIERIQAKLDRNDNPSLKAGLLYSLTVL